MTTPAGPDSTPRSLQNPAQPPLEVESLPDAEPAIPVAADAVERSRRQRVVSAATVARDRTIKQLVTLLVPLIRATRYPLLAVVLFAAVPAVGVVVLALLRPGIDDPVWLVLAAAGLVVAGWLELRRRQLLGVASDPAQLTVALTGLVSGRDMWTQVVDNVSAGKVGKAVVAKRSRPMRVLNGMWRGVQLTGVLTEITERPELIPLMPGRLRGIWFLIIAGLITGAVQVALVLLVGVLYLLGA